MAGSQEMGEADFNQGFGVLQKIAETFRSSVYAFVLIYGALLLWAANAFVYPAEQQRLGQVRRMAENVISCLATFSSSNKIRQGCEDVLKNNSLFYSIKNDKALSASVIDKALSSPGADKTLSVADKIINEDALRMDGDYMAHDIQYQLDKSAEISEFHVPLLGFISDRTWLWAVNIALGPFLYYIIRECLRNGNRLLAVLWSENKDHRFRLILLGTAPIITASGMSRG